MDKTQAKKYTKIAVTLGVIAAGSALLIGLANIITAGPIAQHEYEKKMASIKVIYGDDAKYSDEVVIPEEHKEKYPNLVSYFTATDAAGKELGNVFVTDGNNSYGQIKMSVGINANFTIGKIELIVNGQSFADKVQSDYVDKVNKGDRPFDDVSCGATFGATLINEMGKQALDYYSNVVKKDAAQPFLTNIFGENVTYGAKTDISNPKYKTLSESYTAKDANGKDLGMVFVGTGERETGTIKASVGIKADGEVGKVYVIEFKQTPDYEDNFQTGYVDKYNKGEITLDDTACGSTVSAGTLKEIAKDAQKYYKHVILGIEDKGTEFLTAIFGKTVKYGDEVAVCDANYSHVNATYTATNGAGRQIGYVVTAKDTGDHGVLEISIGVKMDGTITKLFVIKNEHTYADKVNQDYVDRFNKGEITLDDTACGATSSANTVKAMAEEAASYVLNVLNSKGE